MIRVGDTVKFIDDVGGGKVTGFIDKETVNVEGDDGFEIPYRISELINTSVRDEPEIERTSKSAEDVEQEVESSSFIFQAGERINGKDEPAFYFSFVENMNNAIDLYIVNDSNFTLFFHYAHFREDEYISISNGTVGRNSKKKLDSVNKNQLNDIPEYFFQLIYYKDSDNVLPTPIAQKIKVNPVKLFKETSYLPSPFFETKAYTLQIVNDIFEAEIDKISDEDFKKVIKLKSDNHKTPTRKRKSTKEIVEIDLHLHELIDDERDLSNREKLEIQIEKVESEMNHAIKNQVKKIVFIHGVGQGVLKQEVANLLRKKFPKYYFQDASFKEYGYGATMVTIRK